MNIIFAGTPEFAATILTRLLESGIKITACYSQPDRPHGRGQKLEPTKVKEVALKHNIPVYQPKNFKTEESLEELRSLKPDLIIVVAYGLILPQKVLDVPTYGAINIHGSILPKWRGASPVQYAILNGDKETGVSIMQLDKGMDTGDVIATVVCKIEQDDTTATLLQKLAQIGSKATIAVLAKLQSDNLTRTKQNHNLATYTSKINKNDALINWNEQTEIILRKIRAFNPWPICYFLINDINVKVIEAKIAQNASVSPELINNAKNYAPGRITSIDKQGIAIKTTDGILIITKIQFPGSKILSAIDVKNSTKYMELLKPLLEHNE